MPTNAEIWQEIVGLKKRMDDYERKATENQDILKRVEVSVNTYEQSFIKVIRGVRWFGTVATGVLIAYVGSLLIHYIHP